MENKFLEFYNSEHKHRVEQFFVSTADTLSMYGKEEFLKFKGVTILGIEHYFLDYENFRYKNFNNYEGRAVFTELWNALRTLADRVSYTDNLIASKMGEIENLQINAHLILKNDAVLLNYFDRYFELSLNRITKHYIPKYFNQYRYNGLTICSTKLLCCNFSTPTSHNVGKEFDGLKLTIFYTLRDTEQHLQKQEKFAMQHLNTLLSQTEASIQSPSPSPYSPADMAIIQTLRNDREQLIRTLQTPKF